MSVKCPQSNSKIFLNDQSNFYHENNPKSDRNMNGAEDGKLFSKLVSKINS